VAGEEAGAAVITITLNGKEQKIEPPKSIAALLGALNVNPKQVAVAVNGEVMRRVEWGDVTVGEGDAVEIVRAVGGGSRGLAGQAELLGWDVDFGCSERRSGSERSTGYSLTRGVGGGES
jgi:sulfur carrier protein